jgi:xanthine dehydrogenase accessory factor
MKEIRDIIQSFDEAQKQGKKTALATVVHVDGSAYRRPGARMLITEDGLLTGAISGGCLEGDALRKALLVMERQQSMLVTYDTMDEDDAIIGVGLGCNGIIQILIESIDVLNDKNPVKYLKFITNKRKKTVLVSLFSMADRKNNQAGTCLLMDEQGDVQGGESIDPVLKDLLIEDAKMAFTKESSTFKNYISDKWNLTAFIEYIAPVVTLVAIGAGNDVQPLVEIADIIGWETKVADGRANYAKPERFAKACQVLVAKPENVLQHLSIDRQTVFVLMTHNYNYDKAMLLELIKKEARFIGMLGPKKKMERILGELADEGFKITDRQLATIHGPVGLDIGAETPEEIALSIIAEIKAVLSAKEGNSLRQKTDVIHSREATKIEERKLN